MQLKRRIEKLEAVEHSKDSSNRLEVQYGRIVEELPDDYVGEKHLAEVRRLPDGHYEWAERPGEAPNGDSPKHLAGCLCSREAQTGAGTRRGGAYPVIPGLNLEQFMGEMEPK
jgi:hypothetical protein